LIGGPGLIRLSNARVNVYTLHEHWLLCPAHIFWKNNEKACDKAGIEGVTPHTLKHTAVTLGFQSGLTMAEAKDYFATTQETLERVYKQHSPLHNKAAMGPMQRLGK